MRQAAENGATVSICGVRGMGGLGKTQLAYNVAQRMADAFPDGRVLLELRGASPSPMTPEEALGKVISALEPGSQIPTQRDDLRALYNRMLHGKRVLILADDARDATQVDCLLPPTGCAVLITSRQRFLLPSMRVLDLETLSPTEAESLLLEICPRIGAQAAALAKLCGCLPLALRISATLLANDRTTPVDTYLRDLTNERLRLSGLQDPNHPNVPAYSVEASISLSYQALDETTQAILRQLGVFAAGFQRASAEAVVQMPAGAEIPLNRVLSILDQRSLIDYDETIERFSLHDLVRVFALQKLRDAGDEEAAYLRYAQHYVQIANYAHNVFLEGADKIILGLALFDNERANIDAAWNWVIQQAPTKTIDELLMQYANYTAAIGAIRYDKGEHIPHLHEALEAARRQECRQEEGVFLGNLGVAYAHLGNLPKAIECYDQRLEIAREIGDRAGEGRVLGNLGNAYKKLGQVPQAMKYYEQRLKIAREIGDRTGEVTVLGNLGIAYAILGERQKAQVLYEQQLSIAKEMGDRLSEARALGNLGSIYDVSGQIQQATKYYEQQLSIAKELGDLSIESGALGNLGKALLSLGRDQEAKSYFEQQLKITRDIHSAFEEANALGNLGNACLNLGELRQAMEYCGLQLNLAREINDRRQEGYALLSLGNIHGALSQVQEAIGYYKQVIPIFSEIGNQSGIAIIFSNLGACYARTGEVDGAIEYFKQATRIDHQIGDRHGEALGNWNMGNLLLQKGELARAIELMQICVDFYQEIGHRDLQKYATRVDELRRLMKGSAGGRR